MVNPMQWIGEDDNFESAMTLWSRRLRSVACTLRLPRQFRESWVEDRVQQALRLFLDGKPFPADELPIALRRPLAWLRRAEYRIPAVASAVRRKPQWRPYVPSMNAAGDNPAAIAIALERQPLGTAEAIVGVPGEEVPTDPVEVTGGGSCGQAEGTMVRVEAGWRMQPRRDQYRQWEGGTVRASVTVVWRFNPPTDPIQPGPEWTPAPGRPCPAMIRHQRQEGFTYAEDAGR